MPNGEALSNSIFQVGGLESSPMFMPDFFLGQWDQGIPFVLRADKMALLFYGCLMSEAAEGFILLARVHQLVAQSVSTWKTILYSIYSSSSGLFLVAFFAFVSGQAASLAAYFDRAACARGHQQKGDTLSALRMNFLALTHITYFRFLDQIKLKQSSQDFFAFETIFRRAYS